MIDKGRLLESAFIISSDFIATKPDCGGKRSGICPNTHQFLYIHTVKMQLLWANSDMEHPEHGGSQFLFYASADGDVRVQVVAEDETVWASQKGMAEIFGVEVPTINYHLKEVFKSNELDENSVIRRFRITAADGKAYLTKYYNLDAIISVGYRVNSSSATKFRIWATGVLKEYLLKGFALNDDRLKQGNQLFGKDYFEELIERIREIRASERRFYQKVTDVFAQCSVDYDKDSQTAHLFYAAVQNKFHFAIHGKTASELISARSDSSRPNMGLTSWKNERAAGKVLKSDVAIAKNYLAEEEIRSLNRLVSQYLDFAEGLAERRKVMTMTEWAGKLDAFLQFNEYEVLADAGRVSADSAKKKAEAEYEKFRVVQDLTFRSDFDKVVVDIKATGELPGPKRTRKAN